jgi:hypothetical protein
METKAILPTSFGNSHFYLDPRSIPDSSRPDTIAIREPGALGTARLVWRTDARRIEIHLGTPDGRLFASGAGNGTAETGPWVQDGTIFVLQDVSDPGDAKTVAVLVVHTMVKVDSAIQTVATLSLNSRSLVDSLKPTTIGTFDNSGYGVAVLEWNAPYSTAVQIRIGSPTGNLFAGGGSYGSATTGKWVIEGTPFYLVDVSAGLDHPVVVANLVVHVESRVSSMQVRGLASFFVDPGAERSLPANSMRIGPEGYGKVTLIWRAPSFPRVQIRVGSPDGALFAAGASTGSATTGEWVRNGCPFYLTTTGDNGEVSTLAVIVVHAL